jgi:predicted nucleic acid-binding protein
VSGYSLDSNIIIDLFNGIPDARTEIKRISTSGGIWISRVVWIEVMSKGTPERLIQAEKFLSELSIDELDAEIASRAALFRRERPRLKTVDSIIHATAQLRDRILVTRNTKDFPSNMPGIRVPYTL